MSTRTVLRDIDALSAAGVPVYSERGRGGGFELLPGFRTELTGLNHQESLALLTVGSRRGVQAFGLGSALASAILKLFDALPSEVQATASAAADRLLIDPEIDLLSRRVESEEVSPAIVSTVRNAVLGGRRLRFLYAATDGPEEWRSVDPIGLVALRERVYLLAKRSGDDRTYRLSRVIAAEELSEPAERPQDVDLELEWRRRSERLLAETNPVTVVLRVSSSEKSTIVGSALRVLGEKEVADGWAELTATFRDEEHAEWALWQMGTEAEALSPEWLRARLRDRAATVAAQYSVMGT